MIVLSAGLPKSGTAWYYHLTNDLLMAAGRDDAYAVRERYHLHDILDGENCRLVRTDIVALARLFAPHFRGHSYTIKSHAKPQPWLKVSKWIVKPTYIYRDPRDVALSAFNNGQKMRARGQQHQFAKLETIEDAILQTNRWLKLWQAWSKQTETLFVRYEALLANPLEEMHRLATYLSLHVPEQRLAEIVATYQNIQPSQEYSRLHFNKGLRGRYLQEMTEEQIAFAEQVFATSLHDMGYA